MADAIITVSERTLSSGRIHRIVWTWTSATAGTASLVTSKVYNGKLTLLTTKPGSPVPDPNYDITVTDSDGVDVLASGGANRHTTNDEQVLGTSLGAAATSVLTINISNAGAEKKGVVYLDIDTSVA